LEEKGFNVTQGMALLLLKPLNLPANLVLKLIIFITEPKTILDIKQETPPEIPTTERVIKSTRNYIESIYVLQQT